MVSSNNNNYSLVSYLILIAEVYITFILILQTRKLKHREVKTLAHDAVRAEI